MLVTRWITRLGAARCVELSLVLITLSFLAWPWAVGIASMAVVVVPWALGVFSCNSAQQARLSASAPAFAPALLALNTSAIYLGQAMGAATGGAMIATTGFGALHEVALAFTLLALGLSVWLGLRMRHGVVHG